MQWLSRSTIFNERFQRLPIFIDIWHKAGQTSLLAPRCPRSIDQKAEMVMILGSPEYHSVDLRCNSPHTQIT